MAPAGNFECLQAAIQGGADSVYFGVGHLNMRSRSAGNFAPEDLPEVVRICHENGLRCYLTLNIVLYPEDMDDMRATLEAALDALGDREAAVCIELTKLHERVSRGYLSDLVAEFKNAKVKGEVALVIASSNPKFKR